MNSGIKMLSKLQYSVFLKPSRMSLKKPLIGALGCVICFVAVIAIGALLGLPDGVMAYPAAGFLLLGLFWPVGLLVWQSMQRASKFFRLFAEANGFEFEPRFTKVNVAIRLLDVGFSDKSVEATVKGRHAEHAFVLGLASVQARLGTKGGFRYFGFLEVTLHNSYRHLIFDYLHRNWAKAGTFATVNLPGVGAAGFDPYIPKDEGVHCQTRSALHDSPKR